MSTGNKTEFQKMLDDLLDKFTKATLAAELKVDQKSLRTYLDGGNPTNAVQLRIKETYRKFFQAEEKVLSLAENTTPYGDMRDTIIALQAELLKIKNAENVSMAERLKTVESHLNDLREIGAVNHGLIRAMAQQLFPGPRFEEILKDKTLVWPLKGKTKEGK